MTDNGTRYIFDATFIKKEVVAENAYNFFFKVARPFHFQPTQYVWVDLVKHEPQDPKGSRRAFSIIADPNHLTDNTIGILTRTGNSGYKRTLFSLRKGETVSIHGPFGSAFYPPKDDSKRIVIVAGGVGISPFISFFRTLKPSAPDKRPYLIFFHSDIHQACYLKELEQYADRTVIDFDHYPEFFSEKHVISRVDLKNSVFMISGPQMMIDSVYEILRRLGVEDDAFSFEESYPEIETNTLKL